MKKLLLIFSLVISLNLSANSILMSWNCDDLIVSLCENDKMIVGNITYNIMHDGDRLYLFYAGIPLLYVIKNDFNTITIVNIDDKRDKRKLVRCY
jgi:hypothetical protein